MVNNTHGAMERKTLDLLHKARDAANRMEKEEAARLMGEAELHRVEEPRLQRA